MQTRNQRNQYSQQQRTPTDNVSASQEAPAASTTSQATNVPPASPAGHTLAGFAITDRQNDESDSQERAASAKKANRSADQPDQPTGLPTSVKAGAEQLSGLSLDDVHVHYHSPYPDKLDALAYAQGTDIYVGPGQEQHLAHEAWHVVQQKQGQVRPTMQAKGVAINDDQGLESEAQEMGNRAIRGSRGTNKAHGNLDTGGRGPASGNGRTESQPSASQAPVQLVAKSKASINQPDANSASQQVPDLTQNLVDQIAAADDATKRQTVLNDLVNMLNTKGAVDDANLTEVVYVAQQVGSNNAVTQTTGQDPTDKVRITVYPKAFEGGAPVLYSTLRHELIHAGQRLNSPDEDETSFDDDYMQEDLYEGAKGRDADTWTDIERPLQEIETHTWELLHARETGIAQMTDTTYMDSTVNDLATYTATLIQSVVAMPDEAFAYWYNYMLKAVPMLQEVADAYPAATSDKYKQYHDSIAKAARDLNGALADRGDDRSSTKRKNGNDSDTDSSDEEVKPRSKKKNK